MREAHIPGANVDHDPQFSPQAGERGGTTEADDNEKLAKELDRALQQTLAKALSGFDKRMAEFTARLKKVEDQPLPLGTSSVRGAEKSEDSPLPKPEHLLDQPGALEALAEAAIRRAQTAPMRAIPGFRARQG